MIRTVGIFVIWLIANGAQAAGRFASINMCTDQLLLALADPQQIAGLSHLARDPSLSYYWREAQSYPVLSGQAEDVLPHRPDRVMTATFVRPYTRSLLQQQGMVLEEFASAVTIREVKAQIARAGRLLAQPSRADAANARIDAALTRLRATARQRPLAVLPLERRGWISGRDSLLADLLAEAGVRNIGAEQVSASIRLPLEQILLLRPDVLLVSDDKRRAEDQGTALLQHPALTGGRQTERRIVLPHRLTVCAGPMLADAMDHLATELSRLSP